MPSRGPRQGDVRGGRPGSGLERHQLGGEIAEPALPGRRRRCGPDDELAQPGVHVGLHQPARSLPARRHQGARDRKSTRLNSSHTVISYAVFCLKKKKKKIYLKYIQKKKKKQKT